MIAVYINSKKISVLLLLSNGLKNFSEENFSELQPLMPPIIINKTKMENEIITIIEIK
jgi:hypothetical protein